MNLPIRSIPRHSFAYMTVKQVAAAYQLYRAGYSTCELGELLWQRYGYKSARGCAEALRKSFAREGWPIRDKQAQTDLAWQRQRKRLSPDALARWQAGRAAAYARMRAILDENGVCSNGHPRTHANTYTYKGHHACRLCRLQASARYRRRRKHPTEPAKKPPKKLPEQVMNIYRNDPTIPVERLNPILQKWQREDPAHTLETLGERLADQLNVGSPHTYVRRLIHPMLHNQIAQVPLPLADAILTALNSAAWYGELADLYETASWDEAPATPKRPSTFMLTCPKCSHRTPDKGGVDSCEQCGTRLFPHAKRAA